MAFAQKIIYLKFGHLRNLLYGCLVPSAIEHTQYATIAQYAAIAHRQHAAFAQYAAFAVCHPLRLLVTTKGSRVG